MSQSLLSTSKFDEFKINIKINELIDKIEKGESFELSKGINFHELHIILKQNFQKKNIKERIKYLFEITDLIYKEKGIDLSQSIYDFILSFSRENYQKKFSDILNLHLQSDEFVSLKLEDKQQVVMLQLINKYITEYNSINPDQSIPQRQYVIDCIKELFQKLEYIESSSMVFQEATNIGLNSIIATIGEVFGTDNINSIIYQIMEIVQNEISDTEYQIILDLFKEWGVNNEKIEQIFIDYISLQEEEKLSENTSALEYDRIDLNQISQIEKINGKGFLDFNPYFFDLNLENGIEFYGKEGVKKYFDMYFYKIIEIMSEIYHYKLPTNYKIVSFDKNVVGKKIIDNQQEKDIYEHVLRRELQDDFDDKKNFLQIGSLIKTHKIADLNLRIKPYSNFNKKSTKIWPGNLKFTQLSILNKSFDDTNLLVEKDCNNNKKYLRLSLTKVNQDKFIYLIMQISYYLSHKKFIYKSDLYTLIYQMYNKILLEKKEIYNIEFFEEQYQQFIQDIIWPLSVEYEKFYGEDDNKNDMPNTLFYGLYGSGKTQFLLNLIKHNKFKYQDQILHLNSLIISISPVKFVELISSDPTVYKKKLTEIYENTHRKIVFVIEDLDTILPNNGQNSIIDQAITEILQGVGSLPIKLITSTNNLENFNERLTRPFRIDNFIAFNLPLTDKIRENILKIYLQKYNLENYVYPDFISDYLSKTKWFTTSHLAKFIQLIDSHVKMIHTPYFQDQKNTDLIYQKKIINNLFKKIKINIKDIKEKQKDNTTWIKNKDVENASAKIGF